MAGFALLVLCTAGSAAAQQPFGAPQRWLAALNQRGFYVKPGSFADGSGSGLTFSYWKQDFGGRGIDLYASTARSFTGNNYFEVRVGRVPHRVGRIPPRRDGLESLSSFGSEGSPFFAYLTARHRELDQQVFLDGGDRWAFARQDDSYDLVAGYQFSHHGAVSARLGYLGVKLGEASVPMPSASGNSFRIGAELAFDNRDEPSNPHGGGFFSLSLDRIEGQTVAPVGFSRVSVDARRFVSLGSRRHVLAFHAMASAAFRGTGVIPFYLQDSIGGAFTLRGYDLFRFRGDRVAALSGEYRFEAFRFLELAVFGDAGQSWGESTRERSGLRRDVGLGLRLKTSRAVVVRLDAARGDEGTQLNVKFGYSF